MTYYNDERPGVISRHKKGDAVTSSAIFWGTFMILVSAALGYLWGWLIQPAFAPHYPSFAAQLRIFGAVAVAFWVINYIFLEGSWKVPVLYLSRIFDYGMLFAILVLGVIGSMYRLEMP